MSDRQDPVTAKATSAEMLLYSSILRIRPAQLGAFVKKCLGIQRRIVSLTQGSLISVDPASELGFSLLQFNEYEAQMTRLMDVTLRPGDTVFDVGGNEGIFTIQAAARVGSTGRIHTFEPQSRLQSILRENLRLNANTAMAVQLHRVALSDRVGEVTLYLRPSTNTGASSFTRYWKLGQAAETVPTTTIDSFIAEHQTGSIRLMKVDCEGAEGLVIGGARESLLQKKFDFIALDFHPQICGEATCRSIHNQLLEAGYVLSKINGQSIYNKPELQDVLKPLYGRAG